MADKAAIPIIEADEYTDVRLGHDEDGNVTEESISRYNEDDELIRTTVYYYNENGDMVIEENKIDDGEVYEFELTQYNQDGLPETETIIYVGNEYNDGEFEVTIERTYDDNGNEVETKTYHNGELEYDTTREYDENGNEVTVHINDGEGNEKNVIVKEYNEQGDLIKETNSQVTSYDGDMHKEERYFDKEGNEEKSVHTIERTSENGEQTVTVYEYKDNSLEKETVYEDGNITTETIYDRENNEKEIITYDQDGNVESMENDNIYKEEELPTNDETDEDSVTNDDVDDDWDSDPVD